MLILRQCIFLLWPPAFYPDFSLDFILRISVGSHLDVSTPSLRGSFDSSWLCAPPAIILATLLLCTSKVGYAVGGRGSVAHAAAVKGKHEDAEEDDENDDADNDWGFLRVVRRVTAVVGSCREACAWHGDGCRWMW
jgi:hypothetical protein